MYIVKTLAYNTQHADLCMMDQAANQEVLVLFF